MKFRAYDKTSEAWLKEDAVTIDGNGKVFLFGEYYPQNENILIEFLAEPLPTERVFTLQEMIDYGNWVSRFYANKLEDDDPVGDQEYFLKFGVDIYPPEK